MSMKKTSVRYNKHTKLWEAHNGKGFEEHKDRRRVLLYALKCDHPKIYYVIKDISYFHRTEDGKVSLRLIDRLVKAAQLLAKEHVYKDGLVRSQNGENRLYQTRFEGIPKQWSCDCVDFRKGGLKSDYGQMCKHTFAVMIAGFLKLHLPEFYPGTEEATTAQPTTAQPTALDYYASEFDEAI